MIWSGWVAKSGQAQILELLFWTGIFQILAKTLLAIMYSRDTILLNDNDGLKVKIKAIRESEVLYILYFEKSGKLTRIFSWLNLLAFLQVILQTNTAPWIFSNASFPCIRVKSWIGKQYQLIGSFSPYSWIGPCKLGVSVPTCTPPLCIILQWNSESIKRGSWFLPFRFTWSAKHCRMLVVTCPWCHCSGQAEAGPASGGTV